MQGAILSPAQRDPRRRRRRLVYLLRTLWFVAAVLAVEVLLVSLRPGYQQLVTLCSEPPCASIQLTPAGLEALTAIGWSVQAYAIYNMALAYALAAIYCGTAIVIYQARPDEPIALLASLTLVLFGVFMTEFIEVVGTVAPWLDVVVTIMPLLSLLAFVMLFYLFPDGRFVPRWTRWAALGWVLLPFIFAAALIIDDQMITPLVEVVTSVILVISCIVAPIYRYRYVSNPIQRQQTKWVMFGLVQALVVVMVTTEVIPYFFPVFDVAGSLADLVSSLVQFVSLALMPITLGLAMLRHRLWDVDLLLNRTLVYVPLTSILTVIYTTSITFSQKFFSTITGDTSPAAVVLTTIILTTTFTPIKNKLQTWVDHYFKEPADRLKGLRELEIQLYRMVDLLDREKMARQVVEQTARAFGAVGAALYLRDDQHLVLAYATPRWSVREGVELLPLEWNGIVLGQLVLGARRDGADYSADERLLLQQTVTHIVQGLRQLGAWHTALPVAAG